MTQAKTHQPIASNRLPALCDLELYPKSDNLLDLIKSSWKKASEEELVSPAEWSDVMIRLNAASSTINAFHFFYISEELNLLFDIADKRWDMANHQHQLTEDPDINAWDTLANCRAYDSLLK